jgi:hypothetical protein
MTQRNCTHQGTRERPAQDMADPGRSSASSAAAPGELGNSPRPSTYCRFRKPKPDKKSSVVHTAPLTTVAYRRNLNKYCLWLLGGLIWLKPRSLLTNRRRYHPAVELPNVGGSSSRCGRNPPRTRRSRGPSMTASGARTSPTIQRPADGALSTSGSDPGISAQGASQHLRSTTQARLDDRGGSDARPRGRRRSPSARGTRR